MKVILKFLYEMNPILDRSPVVDNPEVPSQGYAGLPGQPSPRHLRVQLNQDLPLQVPEERRQYKTIFR